MATRLLWASQVDIVLCNVYFRSLDDKLNLELLKVSASGLSLLASCLSPRSSL
jgi:hypothetical protein